MSFLLMNDPKKLAATILEGRNKTKPAPQTPDGAYKDNSAEISDRATRLFSALEQRDSALFINNLRGLISSVMDEQTNEASNGDVVQP